jgi:hypothetical protein
LAILVRPVGFHAPKTAEEFVVPDTLLEIPQIKSTLYGKKSFRFAAPTLWNSLPDHFRTENSF